MSNSMAGVTIPSGLKKHFSLRAGEILPDITTIFVENCYASISRLY